MTAKDWKKDVFTIPNLLSFFRLVLIPVYVTIYLKATTPGEYILAACILAVSCLTDMVDGKIARRFNMISTTGKILDPIADKATQLALIVCLVVRYPILWIMIGIFVIKEGYMAIAAFVAFLKGEMLDGALMAGKVCTTLLFIGLTVLVLIPNVPDVVVYIIVAIDSVAMIIALVEYARAYHNHKLVAFPKGDHTSE